MPLTTYMIKFIGHLVTPSILPGSPEPVKTVESDVMVEVDGLTGLREAVSANIIHILRVNCGMICRKDPTSMMSATFIPDDQYFVSMHMISHITTETARIVGVVPDEAKKGYLVQ